MMCCFADVNECESNNGGCAQMCTNTIGAFECSCSDEGYILAANNASCEGQICICNCLTITALLCRCGRVSDWKW